MLQRLLNQFVQCWELRTCVFNYYSRSFFFHGLKIKTRNCCPFLIFTLDMRVNLTVQANIWSFLFLIFRNCCIKPNLILMGGDYNLGVNKSFVINKCQFFDWPLFPLSLHDTRKKGNSIVYIFLVYPLSSRIF